MLQFILGGQVKCKLLFCRWWHRNLRQQSWWWSSVVQLLLFLGKQSQKERRRCRTQQQRQGRHQWSQAQCCHSYQWQQQGWQRQHRRWQWCQQRCWQRRQQKHRQRRQQRCFHVLEFSLLTLLLDLFHRRYNKERRLAFCWGVSLWRRLVLCFFAMVGWLFWFLFGNFYWW